MAGARTIDPDLCVIGGGGAGHAAAFAAAGLGLSCVLIEKRLPLGRGAARDLALDILVGAPPGADFAALRERIGRAVDRAAPLHAAERLRAAGVEVLEGTGRFADGTSMAVGPTTVRARRFVIATGARPVVPAIPGLDVVRHRTSESLHDATGVPERLAVVGRAPEAVELAQAFARLGSSVTLVGGAPAGVDPELWEVVRLALLRDGVDLRPDPVERIEPRGAGAVLHLGGDRPGPVEVTDLLVADGFRPVTDGLGLERGGVARRDGLLVLRPNLRTSNRRVFAVGDVLGAAARGPAGVPAQVATVMRAAFLRQPVRYRPDRIARVLRTDPPLAEVGLSEAEARARDRAVRVDRAPFADNERALATGGATGHLKTVAAANGRVLGAALVGARADDLIAPWVLAVDQGLPLGAIAAAGFAQPSLSHTARRAALGLLVARLRGPWVKRALAVLRRLG